MVVWGKLYQFPCRRCGGSEHAVVIVFVDFLPDVSGAVQLYDDG